MFHSFIKTNNARYDRCLVVENTHNHLKVAYKKLVKDKKGNLRPVMMVDTIPWREVISAIRYQ